MESEHYLTKIAETYKLECRNVFHEFVNQCRNCVVEDD